jgi:hypothetical protein
MPSTPVSTGCEVDTGGAALRSPVPHSLASRLITHAYNKGAGAANASIFQGCGKLLRGESMVEDYSADIWGVSKAFRYAPEEAVEEWGRAVGVLESYLHVAEVMNSDPLMLAIADASSRAREELAGARKLL